MIWQLAPPAHGVPRATLPEGVAGPLGELRPALASLGFDRQR